MMPCGEKQETSLIDDAASRDAIESASRVRQSTERSHSEAVSGGRDRCALSRSLQARQALAFERWGYATAMQRLTISHSTS